MFPSQDCISNRRGNLAPKDFLVFNFAMNRTENFPAALPRSEILALSLVLLTMSSYTCPTLITKWYQEILDAIYDDWFLPMRSGGGSGGGSQEV